jgi:hypothetical protein
VAAEGKTYTGKVAKRCNHILKDYVVQSGNHMGLHGPEELMADYKRREAAGQHADFGISRRYLRTAMCLMKTSQIYMPEQLRNTKVETGRTGGLLSHNLAVSPEKMEESRRTRCCF